MLDGFLQISASEAKLKVAEMKLVIAGALLGNVTSEILLNRLSEITGDSIDGPAVWDGHAPFEQAQAIVGRWQASQITSQDAVSALSEVL